MGTHFRNGCQRHPDLLPVRRPGLRVLLRKDASGGNDPTYDIELWETGGGAPLATLVSGATLSSDTGEVVAATWDASLLGSADGSAVELRIVGDRSNGPSSKRRTVEVGAVEWNVNHQGAPGSELYFLRARYYDPETGRFLSQDPMPFVNLYAYVGNNPTNFTDPRGLWVHKTDVTPDFIDDAIECVGNALDCVRDPIGSCVSDLFKCTYEQRAGITIALERDLRRFSSGDVINKEGGITLITNCRGLCEIVDATAFTVGHTIFTTTPGLRPGLLAHEKRHVRQYEILGDGFWVVYGGSGLVSLGLCVSGVVNIDDCQHDSNILEILASR